MPILSLIIFNWSFNFIMTSSLNSNRSSVSLAVSLMAASCPVSAAKVQTVLLCREVTYEDGSSMSDSAD